MIKRGSCRHPIFAFPILTLTGGQNRQLTRHTRIKGGHKDEPSKPPRRDDIEADTTTSECRESVTDHCACPDDVARFPTGSGLPNANPSAETNGTTRKSRRGTENEKISTVSRRSIRGQGRNSRQHGTRSARDSSAAGGRTKGQPQIYLRLPLAVLY